MTIKKKKACWLFPTNTNNLRMILAQGLLTSPEGFSKYYQDILVDYDGYLSLFNHQIPPDSLRKAVSEADHLTPCLLELDLSKLSGQGWALINNETKEVDITSALTSDDDVKQLLIPLPVPLSCISKIIFKTKADNDEFEKEAKIRSNVLLGKVKLSSTKAEQKLFECSDTASTEVVSKIQLKTTETPKIKPNYSDIYAYGGVLSLLFYNAKNGALSHNFFASFSRKSLPPVVSDSKEQAIPQFIYEYFHGEIDKTRPENMILKGIVSSCIEPGSFKELLINFLCKGDWDEKTGKRAKELADKLDEYDTSNSRSTSEWFKSAQSDIEKLLLMLFTRGDSESFTDFNNPKINFSEREHLIFTIFFGARDGFIRVPAFIRKYRGLQTYISNQMAAYAHAKMKSKTIFEEIGAPKTVWQFVDKGLSNANTKLLGIESCVQTTMSAKAGFKNKQGLNVYEGFQEPKYKVVNEEFFELISTKKITDTEYNKLK